MPISPNRDGETAPGKNEVCELYLKALEIQGFKSFPDKTVLTFGEDITAIVGPNGSGEIQYFRRHPLGGLRYG